MAVKNGSGDMISGMYLYPWETGDLTAFKKEYEKTQCNAMAPALSYHHGNTYVASSGRYRQIKEAALSFSPREKLYGRLQPLVNEEPARSGRVAALREWAGEKNIHFSAWTVLLHNSSLGGKNEDLTVENLFGDHNSHALCPSQAEVQHYEKALVDDICGQFAPDSVMVESVTFPAAVHGGHHEISKITLSPALRWLLSLCFCNPCTEHAAGLFPALDFGALRAKLRQAVLALSNQETLIPGGGDAQIAQLLFEIPGLFEYQLARQAAVGENIDRIGKELRPRGIKMIVIPSAAPFDINRVFMEGMDFGRNAGKADVLLPLVYGAGETYALVRNTIRLYDRETPVGMGISLGPAPDKNHFLGALQEAQEGGCEYFFTYNFSLASAERRLWLAEFNRELPGMNSGISPGDST
jgi:hypothetical protein